MKLNNNHNQKKIFLLSFLFLIIFAFTDSDFNQYDFQGDMHFSKYNFTDIKSPYNGIDSWMEIKIAIWMDNKKSMGLYFDFIPVMTTANEFWWQKNIQLAIGIQFYPLVCFLSADQSKKHHFLKGLRLFSFFAWRFLYSTAMDSNYKKNDFHFGMDYYYDNLFQYRTPFIFLIWSNGTYRRTNFSMSDYHTFVWNGNIKLGHKIKLKSSFVLPYWLTEWGYVPKYKMRWWENKFCGGIGVAFYPIAETNINFFKRLHIYAEYIRNISWLGDVPDLNLVKSSDIRIGLGFSTSGFLKE